MTTYLHSRSDIALQLIASLDAKVSIQALAPLHRSTPKAIEMKSTPQRRSTRVYAIQTPTPSHVGSFARAFAHSSSLTSTRAANHQIVCLPSPRPPHPSPANTPAPLQRSLLRSISLRQRLQRLSPSQLDATPCGSMRTRLCRCERWTDTRFRIAVARHPGLLPCLVRST